MPCLPRSLTPVNPGRTLLATVTRPLVQVDALQRATAIVVLGGGTPSREAEAAALFRAGWAPRIVLVRELGKTWPMNSKATTGHDERLRVLVRYGVPRQCIVVVAEGASTTLQELERVVCVLQATDGPVILVTSPHHTRRVALIWQRVRRARQPGIVRTTCRGLAPRESWRCASSIREMLIEYLALLDLALGSRCARGLA
jgi:uncharacterized SAM-binding protein YcdF (DUF218 family)